MWDERFSIPALRQNVVHPLVKKQGYPRSWSIRQGGKEKQITDTVGGRIQVVEPLANHNTGTGLVIVVTTHQHDSWQMTNVTHKFLSIYVFMNLCVTLLIYQESLHDAWSRKCKKHTNNNWPSTLPQVRTPVPVHWLIFVN